jgi:predicted unusual protein kinase regulating ubiquinone biosynthesis (AarF/ABC1/UbiB family)
MSAEHRDAFARDMVDLFEERCRGYGTNVDVGHVLRGVLGLVRKHRVRIDANFATLVRNACPETGSLCYLLFFSLSRSLSTRIDVCSFR